MKKKIFIIVVVVAIVCTGLFCFFTKNNYKTGEFGNTTIKSAENIKEYILNLESYKAKMDIVVYSNKNQNQYQIQQTYQAPNLARQEILEPQSIKGLTMTYNGSSLKIENTKLNLTKIYENYPYVANNHLWLSDFIEEYKKDNNASLKEEENQIIMQTKLQNQSSKDSIIKTLYIDSKTGKPTKLSVEDKNQKMLVYILYNEIKINSSR